MHFLRCYIWCQNRSKGEKTLSYSQFVGQGLRAVTTGISGSSRRRKIGQKVLRNALFCFSEKNVT